MDVAGIGAQVVEHPHRRVAGTAVAVEENAQVPLRFLSLRIEHPVQRLGRDLVAEPRLVVDVAVQVHVSQVSSPSFCFFPSAGCSVGPGTPSPAWLMGIMLPLTR